MQQTIGGKLIELRERAGLSVSQLSDLSGITSVSIYNVEKGLTLPTATNLIRLAGALGVPVGVFLECQAPRDLRTKKYRRRPVPA